MKSKLSLAAVTLLLSAFASSSAFAQDELSGPAPDHDRDTRPQGRGNHSRNLVGHAGKGGPAAPGNGINYHGGPVIHGVVNVYFIWYGNWGGEYTSANAILTDWANTIGGSPYENINTTYGDTTGNVSGQIALAGQTSDAGSLGTSLSDASIATIVSNALNAHTLPVDPNGVYMVLTAPGVQETSGFLSQYCGWHTYGTFGTTNIKYAFIGDAAGPSLGNCAEQTAKSPNSDPGVDAMVSVMSHELEESVSDPLLNAWYDGSGNENADKCAWTFGTVYAAANGTLANMKLGARDFLIQQNWLNLNGGGCALSYNPAPNFTLSVSPASLAVTQGSTAGPYTVTATPINGYVGTPTYSVTSALPSGASAIVSGNSISLSTSSATPAGTYAFTVTGKDLANNLTSTATATLVVNPLPTPSFTLGIAPPSNTVHRPGSAAYTLTVTPQNGFNGNVTLSAAPLQTGLSYAFSPVTNNKSTLTVTVTNSAKKGPVTITVTGKSGAIGKTATASLQIQ